MVQLTRRQLMYAALPLAASDRPRVSITMDDVAWSTIPEPYRQDANLRLLQALERHHKLKAGLFVVGSNVDSLEGNAIVQSWSDHGHMICNHTWSHRMYSSKVEPAEFSADILRCDALVRRFAHFRPYFRFPALKEGGTRERRDALRAFLQDHGYRNGAVTIDASDWYYDQRLRSRLKQEPGFDVNRYRQPYLAHILNRAQYYDQLARKAVGRSVHHTLLIHYNLLNVLFLGDLLNMFRQNGWAIMNAETAFMDPVFRSTPDTVPAGESLIWALAKQTGRFENVLRYPGEDSPYEAPILHRLGL